MLKGTLEKTSSRGGSFGALETKQVGGRLNEGNLGFVLGC